MTEHLLGDDDYAYVAAQAKAYGHREGWVDAMKAVRDRIMQLPYEIDGEILIDRDEVIKWIDEQWDVLNGDESRPE